MRVLASGQRRGNPDGGSYTDHRCARPAESPTAAYNGISRRGGHRAQEEDRVAGVNPPITYILPDEGWAPLLEIIVRECPTASVIEVNTPGMEALAEQHLQEVDRQDVTARCAPRGAWRRRKPPDRRTARRNERERGAQPTGGLGGSHARPHRRMFAPG